jgi:hypothetical protein
MNRRVPSFFVHSASFAFALASTVGLAGCASTPTRAATSSDDGGPGTEPGLRGALDAFATDAPLTAQVTQGMTCAQLTDKRRHGAVSAFAQRLRATRDAILSGRTIVCFDPSTLDAGAVGGGSATPPSAASTTNDQVAGVNEADIVQHDGRYLYALTSNELVVIQAWPTPGTQRLAAVSLDVYGVPSRFLLVGTKAIVFVRAARPFTRTLCGGSAAPPPSPSAFGDIDTCAGSPSCTPADDGTITRVVTVDLADPARPSVVRVAEMPGSLLGARLVGTDVTTVVGRTASLGYSPFPATYDLCDGGRPRPAQDIVRAFDALFERGRVELEDVLSEPLGVRDRGVREELDCSSVWVQAGGRGESLLTVSTFDAARLDSTIRSARLLGEPGFVYATPSRVYVGSPEGYSPDAGRSYVHRFSIGTATRAPAYEATGAVPGRVFGSYGMSETGDTLHLATSSGTAATTPHMNVFAFEASGRSLAQVGALDDVALGRTLRGVRFLGDRAFVSVDAPSGAELLAVDLQDRRAPRIAGTLASPFAAKYLQRLDANTLLTVGSPARPSDTAARLELVDITELAAPRLLEAIDAAGTTSPPGTIDAGAYRGAITPIDPLAYTYFAEKKLFALPLDVCQDTLTPATFSGVALYDTDRARGFRELARLEADPDLNTRRCWSRDRNHVQRTIFIENLAYLVSDTAVSVVDTRSLGTPPKRIPLHANETP